MRFPHRLPSTAARGLDEVSHNAQDWGQLETARLREKNVVVQKKLFMVNLKPSPSICFHSLHPFVRCEESVCRDFEARGS